MRIDELLADPFYIHGSRKYFQAGFILLPQSDGYVHSTDTEEHESVFERYRPKNRLSRLNSVFMLSSNDINNIDNAGGYNDYVYKVEPHGKVEKSDMGWYSEISRLIDLDSNDSELITIVKNYWNGVPYRNRSHSLWEYRAKSATVVKLLEDNT